jgi:hypothetical protein
MGNKFLEPDNIRKYLGEDTGEDRDRGPYASLMDAARKECDWYFEGGLKNLFDSAVYYFREEEGQVLMMTDMPSARYIMIAMGKEINIEKLIQLEKEVEELEDEARKKALKTKIALQLGVIVAQKSSAEKLSQGLLNDVLSHVMSDGSVAVH